MDDHPTFEQHLLTGNLVEDARTMEPQPVDLNPQSPAAPISAIDPDWDLPDEMQSVREHTSFHDHDTNVYPRWSGARIREFDYWSLLERHATEPRTNHEVRY
ncbi:MAG: hypothetical protein ACK5MR_00075 [Cumulibacter sp.]